MTGLWAPGTRVRVRIQGDDELRLSYLGTERYGWYLGPARDEHWHLVQFARLLSPAWWEQSEPSLSTSLYTAFWGRENVLGFHSQDLEEVHESGGD